MSYNRLTSPNIYVGQRLRIPTQTPPEQSPIIHVVQRGETLYSIARRYGMTVAAIQAANGLRTTTIYVGQRLTIPVGNPAPPGGAQRIQFAPGASSATVAGRTTPGAPQRYVVRAQQGQTMSVVLETANEASYIAVLNPSGENMAGAGGPIHQWEGRLPVTGDYTIEVRATGSVPADFRLTVTIPPAAGPSPGTGQAMIEGVEVRILESYPVQVQAVVRGKLPDACTSIERIEQVRESATFRIRITTARDPNQVCAQVLTSFEQICSLDVAGLPPGRYEVRVNDVATPFDLP
jgi:LysM repeat protein